ncbi:right-handed parallel beta-helix repeat-containing protein [Botryobacter ruber]|uniref:right-handed parallel beta-helix repeat-containing protein n=1 Tax=Botryobacter ruber TaxID=2171629 RepID=UPI000E0B8078|nr:T9SS type A sorting domain-containing protein [Botryobacter ruber]
MQNTFTKQLLFTLLLVLLSTASFAKIYYVAPDGNNSNAGTIEAPFLTIQRSQVDVSPGDTVYIRGGLYTMTEAQIANWNTPLSGLWVYVTDLTKSGTSGKRINYWAYPGEQPVFDYQHIIPANKRINAFQVSGSWIHLKGIEVIGVQVTITTSNTQSICFANEGSNNIYEQLSMHDGQAIGFYLTKGANNLILNCDAYNNYDYTSKAGGGINGGNVDGFGNHPNKGGVNNVFRGCRAWFNSDDGYDCISAHESTVFDNCWAFYNGYSVGFVSRGDGNGFKVGGYGSATLDKVPNPVPRNTTQFCLSVRNKASGFYANHHLAGGDWYNNSAYYNSVNYNMLNRKARTTEDYLTDVPGYDHVMKNNLGFAARSTEVSNLNQAASDVSNNYFTLPVTVTSADFVSLEQALLTAPRKPDGSLPDIDFMRLVPGSDLIDKGVDIGFPFQGAKPDLGYREYQAALGIKPGASPLARTVIYPVPADQVVHIYLPNRSPKPVQLTLFDLQGKKVNSKVMAASEALQLSISNISSGVYFLEMSYAGTNEVISRGKFVKRQ